MGRSVMYMSDECRHRLGFPCQNWLYSSTLPGVDADPEWAGIPNGRTQSYQFWGVSKVVVLYNADFISSYAFSSLPDFQTPVSLDVIKNFILPPVSLFIFIFCV